MLFKIIKNLSNGVKIAAQLQREQIKSWYVSYRLGGGLEDKFWEGMSDFLVEIDFITWPIIQDKDLEPPLQFYFRTIESSPITFL